MSNTYLTALNAVRDIVTYDLIPPFDGMSPTDVDAPLKIQEAIHKLNEIINILNNYRKPYFAMFSTNNANYAITANNQIVPLSLVSGDFSDNADGSITLPSARFSLDIAIFGTFSASTVAIFELYNVDNGLPIATVWAKSENYASNSDVADFRTIVINAPARIGLRVKTKQVSGTLTLLQYGTFLKLVEI